jgi:predicted DNA-binding protein YlxM (UPF0122 family)
MAGRPYQDRDWLYEKYVEEELTGPEIAEAAGCARTTVYDWLDRHNINRDRGEGYRVSEPEKYRDKEWLCEKYHGEKLSTTEIGELCNCHKQTIKLWLEKHDIQKRKHSEAARLSWVGAEERKENVGERFAKIHRVNRPFFFTHKSGYERIGASNGKGGSDFVPVHRLIAVAEYGIDAVKDKVVHHKSNIPWDNRPGNLEIMPAEEHSRMHRLEQENPRGQE